MASSQLEFVPSSPFGCVLRDHNSKEGCRERNARSVQAVFDKNFDALVRDHITGCISLSSPQDSQNHISHNNAASWLPTEQTNATSNPHNLRFSNKNHHHHHNMKNENPTNVPRPPPVLDRWVSRKFYDVNEAAEPLLAPSQPKTPMPSASAQHNLGASSLVQIWEARLNQSNSMNSNLSQSHSMDSNISWTSSGVSCNDNIATEEPSLSDPIDEKIDNRTNNVDYLSDWDSHAASSCIRSFDTGKTEKVRIVDIIKKLNKGGEDADDHEHGNNEHKHCSTSDQAEQRCFSLVVNSPRIRGRQALNDLLTQKEREKNRELESIMKRKAVSKFPKRGCLQSMLRLKSLHHCQTIQDKCRPQLPEPHLNRAPQWPTIMQLRGKFSTGVENVPATWRCLQKDKKSTCKPQQGEDTHCQKGDQSSWRLTTSKNEYVHEQAKPTSDAIQQKTSPPGSLKVEKAKAPSENEVAKMQGPNSQHLFLGAQETTETVTGDGVAKAEQDLTHESQNPVERSTPSKETGEEEGNGHGDEKHLSLDSQSHEIVEWSSTSYMNDSNENDVIEEEEEDPYRQYFDESNDYDWVSNISRPKSHWESLRKAWYHEVLNTTSKNGEIRQLVQRGKVSSLLVSDFRQSMDRLLTSRIQLQADGAESQQDVEDMEGNTCRGSVSTLHGSDFLERMNGLMTCRAQIEADEAESRQAGDQGDEEEDEDDDDDEYEDEEEEDEETSLSSHQCPEVNNCCDHSSSSLQMPSPSALVMRSWSCQDDNETGNDYERRASVFSPPPQPSHARQSSPSKNRTSLEMEHICDLRGDIQQLRHEMSELRKSILSCMNMHMKFQHHCFDQKVHSVEGDANIPADRIPMKRSCCICYEKQVDSLLYRCGHMCTCLKCGSDLQCKGGKCPMCGASILDVVPAK
ncbi:hypothetical protein V6N13_062558 [Hibiscus sabdariffa]